MSSQSHYNILYKCHVIKMFQSVVFMDLMIIFHFHNFLKKCFQILICAVGFIRIAVTKFYTLLYDNIFFKKKHSCTSHCADLLYCQPPVYQGRAVAGRIGVGILWLILIVIMNHILVQIWIVGFLFFLSFLSLYYPFLGERHKL